MWRLVKLWIPDADREDVLRTVAETDYLDARIESDERNEFVGEFIVATEKTEAFVEAVEGDFGTVAEFRIVTLGVEATVPQPEDPDETSEEASDDGETSEDEPEEDTTSPINIEELYDDVTAGLAIDSKFVAMAVLSSIVAAIGIIRSDVAVVIAAMIIAPLLQPNMSLSLATTLADRDLAQRSIQVNAAGLGLSLGVAVLFGLFYSIDPSTTQIELRTQVGLIEIALAASAGAAGALSYTSGESSRVVGVMVAVALLPPVVVLGMLLGAGRWNAALGAFYLTSANIVCLNLCGVVTFLLQHVRPRNAFESKRADRATRHAIIVWVVLLAILIATIWFGGAI
ncbi:MAG: TIGR00341 family protein [Bradymonadaceae bacterium]